MYDQKVLDIKLKYEPLLEAAPTFNQYKELQLSMERQIKRILGVPNA